MPASISQDKTQHINAQYIIGTLLRRRWYIIIPIAAAFLISVPFSFIMPKVYEASSTVLVRQKKIIDPLVSQIAVSPDIRELLNTLSKQVLAWPRLEQLVTQLNMAEAIESPWELEKFILKMKSRITVRMKGKELIHISFHDKDPKLAQKVVNTLTLNFIEENTRIKKEDARNAIDFIGEQLKIYRKKLGDSQKNFSTSKIDSELRIAYNRKQLLEERMAKLHKLIPSQVTREQSAVVVQLKAQLGTMEAEYARLMIDAKEGNPRVKELKRIIKELKQKIKQERGKETVKESISVTNPMYLQADQELKKIEMELNYLEGRKKELEKIGEEIKKPVTEEELMALERDKKIDEDIYNVLLKQLEAAYVSERLQDSEKGSRFTVIEYGRLPLKPIKPNKLKVILMGLFLGCCAGGGLVFLIEYVDKSFITMEDARDFLPKQVYGAVSSMVMGKKDDSTFIRLLKKDSRLLSILDIMSPFKLDSPNNSPVAPEIVFHHNSESRVSEEYRIIRTAVTGLKKEGHSQTIMITSSILGEGKTVTSSNMAVAMAHRGSNTLLIDCDLRKGYIHKLFSIKNSAGITDALKSSININSTLVKSSIENLTIIPRGSNPDNPSELLSSDKTREVFEQLKKNFDTIIIDSPPVLNLSDSSIIGKYADNVILVVQMERTQRQDAVSAHDMLAQADIDVSGFIMTHMRYYMPNYMYNYYYAHYGRMA